MSSRRPYASKSMVISSDDDEVVPNHPPKRLSSGSHPHQPYIVISDDDDDDEALNHPRKRLSSGSHPHPFEITIPQAKSPFAVVKPKLASQTSLENWFPTPQADQVEAGTSSLLLKNTPPPTTPIEQKRSRTPDDEESIVPKKKKSRITVPIATSPPPATTSPPAQSESMNEASLARTGREPITYRRYVPQPRKSFTKVSAPEIRIGGESWRIPIRSEMPPRVETPVRSALAHVDGNSPKRLDKPPGTLPRTGAGKAASSSLTSNFFNPPTPSLPATSRLIPAASTLPPSIGAGRSGRERSRQNRGG